MTRLLPVPTRSAPLTDEQRDWAARNFGVAILTARAHSKAFGIPLDDAVGLAMNALMAAARAHQEGLGRPGTLIRKFMTHYARGHVSKPSPYHQVEHLPDPLAEALHARDGGTASVEAREVHELARVLVRGATPLLQGAFHAFYERGDSIEDYTAEHKLGRNAGYMRRHKLLEFLRRRFLQRRITSQAQ